MKLLIFVFSKAVWRRIINITICFFVSSPVVAENNLIQSQPLTAVLPAHSGVKTVTTDFLLSLPNNFESSTIQWQDNSHLLYSIPSKSNDKLLDIGLIDIKTKVIKSLGVGMKPLSSPDGQYITFIKELNHKKQLWVMQKNGTQLRQLTNISNGLVGFLEYNYDFAWSPDSKSIVLSHQPEHDFWIPANKKVNKDQSSAMDGDGLLTKPPQTKISIIDVLNGKDRLLASLDARVRYISWMPDGKNIFFMMEREAITYNQKEDKTWIKSMNVANGKMQTLLEFTGLQQRMDPVVSGDNNKIAYLYDSDNPLFSVIPSIWVASAKSSATSKLRPTQLTHELKLFSPQWSKDGSVIYARRDYGAYRQIYTINAQNGRAKQVTNAPMSVTNFALSPEGKQLAWIGPDAHGNFIIRIANKEGQNINEVAIFPSTPKEIALSEIREIEWSTTNYPAKMKGILVMPLNYQVNKHYPLITDIHGGDVSASIYMGGAILVSTPLEWQLWAAKGYAVFIPEFRSSGSFGSLAIKRDDLKEHDLVNKDMQDVLSGIDSLIDKGIADPKRIYAIGHSAGGKRVNWLAVSTHRFNALISKEGWADEWFVVGIHPIKRNILAYGGAPVIVPENYQKNSALFHAKGATTPILFLMSSPEKGVDRYGSVRWLYQAIKAQGIETQYIQYPDEGHVLERSANRKDALERAVKWLDRH